LKLSEHAGRAEQQSDHGDDGCNQSGAGLLGPLNHVFDGCGTLLSDET
jgi:hypothetical protein